MFCSVIRLEYITSVCYKWRYLFKWLNISVMALSTVVLNLFILPIFISSVVCENCDVSTPEERYLFDFTNNDDVQDWQEQSDTVRSVGMSKATIVLHENTEYRRAVFFALLNPQPDGAGFAGMRIFTSYNLTCNTELQISCRGQGQYKGFKIVLRHKGLNNEPNFTFEQFFTPTTDEFDVQTLPFSDFKPYYRGKMINTNETLDISQITSFGIQMYGGVYLPIKQKGPATLEINWIKAV